MKSISLCIVLITAVLLACNGQNPTAQPTAKENEETISVGGGCDGCEIMYIGMPQNIKPVDTSAGWHEKGQKLLLAGTVYKLDAKTPAPNVIIYYWQTDNDGYYSPRDGMDEKAKRHGHIRGWVKTDDNGKYAIYTIRPVAYPNTDNPAHIHTSIKEPGKSEYYIDEFVFDDDPLLTANRRKHFEKRGGSGILKVKTNGKLQVVEHPIFLGRNIPDYPKL